MATQKGRNWSSGDIVTAANLSSIERGVSAMAEEYTPTTWANGNTVTAAALNNIEQGIVDGGSSDFSTAEVTITYQSMQIANLFLAHITSADGVKPTIFEETGEEGKTVVYNVPLYMSKALCVAFDGAENLQGSIVDNEDGTYTITGNCSFTASLGH